MALTTISSLAESYVSSPAHDSRDSTVKEKDVIKMTVDVSDCIGSELGSEGKDTAIELEPEPVEAKLGVSASATAVSEQTQEAKDLAGSKVEDGLS
jgi:hypothetical protein